MKEKYRIDTEENKLFADEIRNNITKEEANRTFKAPTKSYQKEG